MQRWMEGGCLRNQYNLAIHASILCTHATTSDVYQTILFVFVCACMHACVHVCVMYSTLRVQWVHYIIALHPSLSLTATLGIETNGVITRLYRSFNSLIGSSLEKHLVVGEKYLFNTVINDEHHNNQN